MGGSQGRGGKGPQGGEGLGAAGRVLNCAQGRCWLQQSAPSKTAAATNRPLGSRFDTHLFHKVASQTRALAASPSGVLGFGFILLILKFCRHDFSSEGIWDHRLSSLHDSAPTGAHLFVTLESHRKCLVWTEMVSSPHVVPTSWL